MKTMFKFLSLGAFALVIASVSGCGNSKKDARTVPEFDGGYVKTDSGDFVQLTATRAYTTGVGEKPSNLSDYITGKVPLYYYTTKLSSAKVIDSSSLKGLEIKGQYQFKDFSLHLLKPMVVDGDHDIFYHNKGPATEGQAFYVPGAEIATQRKSTGPDSYYFQPRAKLSPGIYIAWTDDNFWLFGVNQGSNGHVTTSHFNGVWKGVGDRGEMLSVDFPKVRVYRAGTSNGHGCGPGSHYEIVAKKGPITMGACKKGSSSGSNDSERKCYATKTTLQLRRSGDSQFQSVISAKVGKPFQMQRLGDYMTINGHAYRKLDEAPSDIPMCKKGKSRCRVRGRLVVNYFQCASIVIFSAVILAACGSSRDAACIGITTPTRSRRLRLIRWRLQAPKAPRP